MALRLINKFLLFGLFLILSACTEKEETIIIPKCHWEFTQIMGEQIPVIDFEAPYSYIIGNTDNFINMCKPIDINPLFFKDSIIKTHQIIFSFDAIYPVSHLELTNYIGDKANKVDYVSIEVSLNGLKYKSSIQNYSLDLNKNTINLDGESARYIKIIFKAEEEAVFGIQDVRFYLGEGYIVKEDDEWTDAFMRYEHWTGADGIYSYNLNGYTTIGSPSDTIGFIFSDTFTGPVNSFNKLRNNLRLINNSVGYYDGNEDIFDGMTFDYRLNEHGHSQSAFIPDQYIGYKPSNLLDSDGLTIYQDKNGLLTNEANGIMWLTNKQSDNYIILDFYNKQYISDLYLWNFNETPLYGIKQFDLLASDDGFNFINLSSHDLNQSSGSDNEPFTKVISVNREARYLKINITDTYHNLNVGLGKIYIENELGNPLFAKVSASNYNKSIKGNELSSRLWLQDGIIIGDNFYVFPILVKDDSTIFKVTRVGMIRVPIVEKRFDFMNAVYLDSPLQGRTPDGGVIYYGAGIMNHTIHDGYVYVYGYKDLHGRHLTVARVKIEDIENFNLWTYFDGNGWSNNINDSYPIINRVSPELSVTYIESGMYEGKYKLVVMEGSVGVKVSYAISDKPYGPFSDYNVLYETKEGSYLRDAITYNAKMHPAISEPGNYLISYNVNSLTASALFNADIYRPRFIRVTEVKKP